VQLIFSLVPWSEIWTWSENTWLVFVCYSICEYFKSILDRMVNKAKGNFTFQEIKVC
jgi:hypothetical protein